MAPGLIAALALPLVLAGCVRADTGAAATSAPVSARVARPAFDGEAAFKFLVKQCDFGPRVPGTDGHSKCQKFLTDLLRSYTPRVATQDFRYRDVPMANIIARFGPAGPPRVLLCAHWDTRPRAEMEIDPAKKSKPIPGADDGASGVAVLLELAREFKQQQPSVGVVIALLDGEDYGDFDRDEGVLLGASYLAKHQEPLGGRPTIGILLDMVGGRNLQIPREANSERFAKSIDDMVFAAARELGHADQFPDKDGSPIIDDHIPLCAHGIPTIDLIDFNYGPWHTLEDTPDKCSAKSLAAVGDTVAEVVYRQK